MKIIAIIGGITILGVVGYAVGSRLSGSNEQKETKSVQKEVSDSKESSTNENAERLRGRVMDISEEKIIIGIYENQGRTQVDREKMQSLSDAERQALREEMRAAREEQGEPKIVSEKIIVINDETVFVKNTGFGRQGNKQERQENGEEQVQGEEIALSDIEEGTTVNIILSEDGQVAQQVIIQVNSAQ